MALPGVIDIMRASDVPQPEGPSEAVLTDEPKYEGEPILAVTAVDEETAAAAIELIDLDLEPLPFVLDPLQSLRPGGPNAFLDGNQFSGQDGWSEFKWTAAGLRRHRRGRFPSNVTAPVEWTKGDVDAGFAEADYVLEEVIVHQSVTHHPMEPRSTMAYWDNGRLHAFVSTQRAAHQDGPGRRARHGSRDADVRRGVLRRRLRLQDSRAPAHAPRAADLAQDQPAGHAPGDPLRGELHTVAPAPASRAGSRWASVRTASASAIDLIIVQDSGPYGAGDFNTAANIADLTYTPGNMRFRGVPVYTNTPPKAAQRGPGGAQINGMLEPLIDKAARELGIDRIADPAPERAGS
jgi:xanthine dehydrogenase molybdenum-binding subunit